MTDIQNEVERAVGAAAERALSVADLDPLVRPAKDLALGDYQANLALGLAKQLKQKPAEIAAAVVSALQENAEAGALFESVEVAGPGFINLKLSSATIAARLDVMSRAARLGVPVTSMPRTVVVDYSGPNLAKEMHVGHLRSSIIGDAICRTLAFHGDRVIRQNHLGDWGTQFGMLIEHLIDVGWDESGDHSIRDLDELYQAAKKQFDADTDFAARARARVVQLQSGEERSLALWRKLIDESVRHMNAVYAELGVLLENADVRPESFYNPHLPAVVSDLRALGLGKEDAGAQVVFPEGFRNKEGAPLPLIVQKSDGGYGYATTDLAAARYRVEQLGATRVIYVVDARQADHFGMVFWTLRAAAWAPADKVALDYVPFGTVLGNDRKPFKTRDGGTVKLVDLLSEAVTRAQAVIEEKNPDLDEATRRAVARAVGIGAVKYADLSSERIKDYVFDYDRMLAFDGNTAPYLQYAYVRVCSIFRKADFDPSEVNTTTFSVGHATERALGVHLLRLPRAIQSVVDTLEPHRLCAYLYELAALFHAFHRSCRVLNAETETLGKSRLALCRLVARTLKQGLELLGIDTIEQM